MGHYQDDYELASADLVEYFGQPISYLDDSLGSAATCASAQCHPEKAERRKNDYGWYLIQTRIIKYVSADLLDGDDGVTVVTARSDGTVTVDSVDYSIESLAYLPGGRTQLNLTRASAGEVGRPDYRGR